MKSFNQHPDKEQEKLNEDLTGLLWAAAAGGGLLAAKGAWDKWGTQVVASLPFATDAAKAAAIDKNKEQKDKKIEVQKKLADDPKSSASVKRKAEKELDKLLDPVAKAERATEKGEKKKGDTEKLEKGKLATGEYSTDKAGIIDNQGDAQKYRDATGSAPEGWATSDGKTPDGAAPKPAKGKVWTTDDEEKWKDKEEKRKDDIAAKKAVDAAKETGNTDNTDTSSFEPKGTKMTITESNELQAIMALDDAGIKAEINRKGEVVVKKKDLKKAKKALEKSFRKGGQPKLVGEETLGDVLDQIVKESELEERLKDGQMVTLTKDLKTAKKGFAKGEKVKVKIISGMTHIEHPEKPSVLIQVRDLKKYVKEEVEIDEKQISAYDKIKAIRNKLNESSDEHAETELKLYIDYDRDLYRQQVVPIIKNVQRRMKKGTYDHIKAPKLWMYLVDNGAKKYVKEFGGDVKRDFPKDVRQSVAVQFANEYKAEIDIQGGDML